MIFSDMGVHPTSWGYSVYAEVILKLIARGIPRAQIAAVGDADTDAKKQALFKKVRSGQRRTSFIVARPSDGISGRPVSVRMGLSIRRCADVLGAALPCSHRFNVTNDTPSSPASAVCVRPDTLRRSRSCFVTVHQSPRFAKIEIIRNAGKQELDNPSFPAFLHS